MGDRWTKGTPSTAASVEESPPGLVMNKSQKRLAVAGGTREKMKELLKGITIMKEEPKVLLGGIVRVINTTAQFAFPVFLPMYMADYGFTTTEWLRIWGTIFTANIVFNLIFGFVMTLVIGRKRPGLVRDEYIENAVSVFIGGVAPKEGEAWR